MIGSRGKARETDRPGGFKKPALAALALLALAAFWYFDLQRFLTLDYLKAQQENFRQVYNRNPAAFLLGYGLVYVLVAAFSLPGAAVLTLAGGGLFGLGRGLAVVSLCQRHWRHPGLFFSHATCYGTWCKKSSATAWPA